MDKGGAARSVQITLEEKSAPSLERSPAQIIKPFKKKKRTQRRGAKQRPCRWCPPQTKLKIRGKKCSLQAFIYKRIPPQCHETSYGYANVKQASPPSKAADSGWSNVPGLPASRRNSSRKGTVESSEKRRDFSSAQESQRQLRKLNVVEKRRYHTISEYQFTYPGKAIFHCTRETVKQHLRSIYLGNAGQKPAKAAHPLPVRILPGCWAMNRTRQNTFIANNAAAGRCQTYAEKPESLPSSKTQHSPTQAHVENEPHHPQMAKGTSSPSIQCPVGSELLRSGPFSSPPRGLPEPSYKSNQSVPVHNKALTGPENPPPAPTVVRKVSSRLNPPAPEEASSPPAEDGCHRMGGCPTQKRGQGWDTHQRYSPELPRKDVENVVTALSAGSPKSQRPVPAKDHCKDAPNQTPSRGEDRNEELSGKKDVPANKPAHKVGSKLSIAKARSAVIIPTIAPYSMNQSAHTEASWDVGSTPNLFPFAAEQHPTRGIFCQTPLGEMRQAGPPACSSLEKRGPGNALGGTDTP